MPLQTRIQKSFRRKVERWAGIPCLFYYREKNYQAHAEIDDTSCLQSGCHRREDLKKNVVFKNVVFNHLHHLDKMKREKQLRCTTCHSQIVQGTHITVTEVNCFICHFYKTKDQKDYVTGCTSCHFEAKGDIEKGGITFNHKQYIKRGIKCDTCHTSVVTGDGHNPENVCLQCHNKREILEAKYTPEALHSNHVTDHKVECFLCHTPIKHGTERLHTSKTDPRECSQCHKKGMHNEKLFMYTGRGAKMVKDMPGRMAALDMDCNICHAHGSEIAKDSCKNCHGDRTDGMVDRWKKIMKDREEALSKEIAEVKGIVKKKDVSETERKKLNDAIYNQQFLQKGNPVHNILYSMKIADETGSILADIKSRAGEATKKPAKFKISCTEACHKDIGERKIPFGGGSISFAHEIHAEGEESCLKCHSPYGEHGKTRFKGCSECHHNKGMGKVVCTDCHKAEAVMSKSKDSFHGKIQCVDCHSNIKYGKKEALSAIRNNCIRCHKKGYEARADEWVEKGRAITAKYSETKAALEKEMAAAEKSGGHSVPLMGLFDEINEDMGAVIMGRYAHNPRYSDTVAEKIGKNMGTLQMMMKEKREGKPIFLK